MSNSRPPVGNLIEQINIVLAESNEIIARQNASQGLGNGEPEVIAGRIEATADLLVGIGDELRQAVGRNGGEDGEGGGSDIRVGELEVVADAGADGVPEISGEARGSNKVKGELLADGGGRGGDDLLDGGLGDDGDVAAGGGLLKSLEESAGLAEGVVGAEVRLDLSKENVHGNGRRRSKKLQIQGFRWLLRREFD